MSDLTSTGKSNIATADEPQNKTENAVERHPLVPFLPFNAKVLMLGSFPPPKSRWSMDFYYPNFLNDMWRVFGLLFNGDKNAFVLAEARSFDKDSIMALLKSGGIALFDTATAVVRLRGNASDNFLQIVEKTDYAALLRQMPDCRDIAATGQKAAETVCSEFGVKVPKLGESVPVEINGEQCRIYRMPSTSRAYPMKLEAKAIHYQRMFAELGIIR